MSLSLSSPLPHGPAWVPLLLVFTLHLWQKAQFLDSISGGRVGTEYPSHPQFSIFCGSIRVEDLSPTPPHPYLPGSRHHWRHCPSGPFWDLRKGLTHLSSQNHSSLAVPSLQHLPEPGDNEFCSYCSNMLYLAPCLYLIFSWAGAQGPIRRESACPRLCGREVSTLEALRESRPQGPAGTESQFCSPLACLPFLQVHNGERWARTWGLLLLPCLAS